MTYPKLAALRTPDALRGRLEELGVELGCDDLLQAGPDSPLGRPLRHGDRTIGNRFAILPM